MAISAFIAGRAFGRPSSAIQALSRHGGFLLSFAGTPAEFFAGAFGTKLHADLHPGRNRNPNIGGSFHTYSPAGAGRTFDSRRAAWALLADKPLVVF